MESMRDINRVMEREIAKGSCPLKLDHIEFGDYSYQDSRSMRCARWQSHSAGCRSRPNRATLSAGK